MINKIYILVSCLLIFSCKKHEALSQEEKAQKCLIEGMWGSRDEDIVYYYDKDGEYTIITRGSEEGLSVAHGKWILTDRKIYSHLYNDPLGFIPSSRTIDLYSDGSTGDAIEVEGAIYEFIGDEGKGNVVFAHITEKGMIIIDKGDYMDVIYRMEKIKKGLP